MVQVHALHVRVDRLEEQTNRPQITSSPQVMIPIPQIQPHLPRPILLPPTPYLFHQGATTYRPGQITSYQGMYSPNNLPLATAPVQPTTQTTNLV